MRMNLRQFMNSVAVSCMSVLLGSAYPLTGKCVQNLVLAVVVGLCMLHHFYKWSVAPDQRIQ